MVRKSCIEGRKMKIELEVKSNGIHSFISTIVRDACLEDEEFLGKLLKIVDEYNKEQVENA